VRPISLNYGREMLKPIVLALALSALGSAATRAHAQTAAAKPVETPPCLKYTPEQVQLVGHLEQLTYPNGPSFPGAPPGDTPEAGLYLRVAHPVCTVADANRQARSDVTLLQLVVDSAGYKKLRLMADKEIVVHGTLSPAMNGHHHTPVVLMPSLPVALYRAP
jgi:hypothetical protein